MAASEAAYLSHEAVIIVSLLSGIVNAEESPPPREWQKQSGQISQKQNKNIFPLCVHPFPSAGTRECGTCLLKRAASTLISALISEAK